MKVRGIPGAAAFTMTAESRAPHDGRRRGGRPVGKPGPSAVPHPPFRVAPGTKK